MKGRDSGMPEEEFWSRFFDVDGLIDTLVTNHVDQGDVAEFGSGYGTFTIPTAQKVSGVVHGFEIEADLVAFLDVRLKRLNLQNVRLKQRDLIENGTGLPDGSMEHVMIYNLLHIEHPVELLTEAHRILRPSGTISVIHWRRDIPTPRGPSMEIRPSPEQCITWAKAAGFARQEQIDIAAFCPYHFGIQMIKS